MADDFESALEGTDPDRRTFLKKLAVGTAFAAPVVSSFTMTGIKAAYAQTASASGDVGAGNQENTTTTAASNQTTSSTTTTTTTDQTNQTEDEN